MTDDNQYKEFIKHCKSKQKIYGENDFWKWFLIKGWIYTGIFILGWLVGKYIT